MATIDRVLPEWDVSEVHDITLPCSPEQALETVLGLPAASDRLVRLLFRVGGLGAGRTRRVVGPFSALIRRRWLAGVRRSLDAG